LRSVRNVKCYDEPFHPRLADGARQNHKGTWAEFSELLSSYPSMVPEPIQPAEELDPVYTPAQKAWLGALCASHTPVVIDIVRGWNRTPSLHVDCGDVLNVHLVREPASWVAAHLLPTGAPTFRRRVAGVYRRVSFFHRRGFYDNYQYQTIIDAALEQDHPVFNHVSLSRAELSLAPAYVKLLAFWWGANCTLAQRLAAADSPQLTIALGAFSRQPDAEIARIAEAAGWADPRASTATVKVGRPTYAEQSPRWRAAARRLGLPETLFNTVGQDSESLSGIFEVGGAV